MTSSKEYRQNPIKYHRRNKKSYRKHHPKRLRYANLRYRKKKNNLDFMNQIFKCHRIYVKNHPLRVRRYIREYENKRYHTDEKFATSGKLHLSVYQAWKQYIKTGKIRKKSKKYDIDYESIIKHLSKLKNHSRKGYVIAHLIPTSRCLPREIKIVFMPENMMWLTATENHIIGNKVVLNAIFRIKNVKKRDKLLDLAYKVFMRYHNAKIYNLKNY